jgi:hypothetical protein
VRKLAGWDTYVREAARKNVQSIELPLTPDECYVVDYPTRRRGRKMDEARQNGDTDALMLALLGEEAGSRVLELAEDEPAYVLDEMIVDIMRKFGMLPEDESTEDADVPWESGQDEPAEDPDEDADEDADEESDEPEDEPEDVPPPKTRARRTTTRTTRTTNGAVNGRAGRGKSAAAASKPRRASARSPRASS